MGLQRAGTTGNDNKSRAFQQCLSSQTGEACPPAGWTANASAVVEHAQGHRSLAWRRDGTGCDLFHTTWDLNQYTQPLGAMSWRELPLAILLTSPVGFPYTDGQRAMTKSAMRRRVP